MDNPIRLLKLETLSNLPIDLCAYHPEFIIVVDPWTSVPQFFAAFILA
jgi:hypothetical protein